MSLSGDRGDMGLCQWRYTEVWGGHFQVQRWTCENCQKRKWASTQAEEIMMAFLLVLIFILLVFWCMCSVSHLLSSA